MIGFSFALIVASFCLSLLACLFAAAAVTRVSALQQVPHSGAKLSARLTEIEDAIQEVATSVRMMKTRRAARSAEPSSEIPDPYKEPDKWRAVMNARRAGGLVQ